jgi:serine protease AprX
MTFSPTNRARFSKNSRWLFIVPVIIFPLCSQAAELRACLNKLQARDTICRVWVVFTDKNSNADRPVFSKHALSRRMKAGFSSYNKTDLPVPQRFISEVEQSGGVFRNVFPWANAASFSIHASKLSVVAAKKCVKEILPVRTFVARNRFNPSRLSKSTVGFPDSGSYGLSLPQMRIPGVPEAHNYIMHTLNQTPGDSVIIGLFDSGFRLNHRCLSYVKSHNSIIADSNFVDHNGEVSDPDSIRKAFLNAYPYFSPPEEHGSQTLSLIGGYDPGKFLGVAWGAQFVLGRTEWVGFVRNGEEVDIEMHSEEDNFAAALVWAESLGVDIVSSSLAYSTGFTDSSGNPRPQDDITFSQLDGRTTIISHAALEATKRGMIIVNSMGNEGPTPGSVNAPADVADVVSVGGVFPNKLIWDSSSRGPTADGRIKPDVVTLSKDVYLPDIYSPDSSAYTYGSGTSFAAPVIAGICGLIRQTHPNDPASEIRRRLYASCSFAPKQDSVDNAYGRGIPNALTACFSDSLTPVAGANFVLFPTTLDIVRKKQQLTLELRALPDDPLHYSQVLKVSILAMNGALVWGHTEYLKERNQVKIRWPELQKSYAPGMYYFIINYAGKTHTRKFIILG